jgi:hypothetical protein
MALWTDTCRGRYKWVWGFIYRGCAWNSQSTSIQMQPSTHSGAGVTSGTNILAVQVTAQILSTHHSPLTTHLSTALQHPDLNLPQHSRLNIAILCTRYTIFPSAVRSISQRSRRTIHKEQLTSCTCFILHLFFSTAIYILAEISGSHGGEYEDGCLLWRCTVQSIRRSYWWCSGHFWNFCQFLRNYTTTLPKTVTFVYTLHQILYLSTQTGWAENVAYKEISIRTDFKAVSEGVDWISLAQNVIQWIRQRNFELHIKRTISWPRDLTRRSLLCALVSQRNMLWYGLHSAGFCYCYNG